MKLLVIVSSLDLTQPFSATPAWWQFLKALYEVGVDLIVTPYQGLAIETPWWRAAPNPARLEGDMFKRPAIPSGGLPRQTIPGRRDADRSGEPVGPLVRRTAQTVIAPRWRRHSIDCSGSTGRGRRAGDHCAAEPSARAGTPHHGTASQTRIFYDGDVPASLPNFTGFVTASDLPGCGSVRIHGVFSNSEGGKAGLRELGAREVHTRSTSG